MSTSDRVAQRMHERRKARGWNAAQLARACALVTDSVHITNTTIYDIESGRRAEDGRRRRRVSVDELVVIAAALRADPADLLALPSCDACNDAPPPGYACLTCRREATR